MHKSVAREREQVMKNLRKRQTDGSSLPCKVLRRLYGRLHPLHGEEGRQVGRVGADHDQGEEPPHGRDHPGGDGLGGQVTSLLHQGPHSEPHGVAQGEFIHQNLLFIAGMRIVPFIRTKSKRFWIL